MLTVCDTLGVPPVTTYSVPEEWGNTFEVPQRERAIGIEFEVEAVDLTNWIDDRRLQLVMQATPDGSLRNNGMEFVTFPIKAKDLSRLTNRFLSTMRITKENHSERTSTHVHVNVGDFNIQQLLSLCLLYSVFERMLFSYVGNERDNSIFCVPWYASGISSSKAKTLVETFKKRVPAAWEKYTALNLAPVTTQQTVEFRHLGGVTSVKELENWVGIILSLVHTACTIPLFELQEKLVELNNTSNYVAFAGDVFLDRLSLMVHSPEQLKEAMFDGVIQAKLFLGDKKLSPETLVFEDTAAKPAKPASAKQNTTPRTLLQRLDVNLAAEQQRQRTRQQTRVLMDELARMVPDPQWAARRREDIRDDLLIEQWVLGAGQAAQAPRRQEDTPL